MISFQISDKVLNNKRVTCRFNSRREPQSQNNPTRADERETCQKYIKVRKLLYSVVRGKSMKQIQWIGLSTAALFFMGCSQAEFRLAPDAKTETLAKSSVFGEGGVTPVGGDGQGGVTPVGGDGQGRKRPPVGGDGGGASSGSRVGATHICSDRGVEESGGKTVANSAEVKVVIREFSGGANPAVVCTLENQKAGLLASRSIDLTSCNLTARTYFLNIHPSNDTKTSLLYETDSIWGSVIEKSRSSMIWQVQDGMAGKLKVLLDQNPNKDIIDGDENPLCQEYQSPLVINMTPEGGKDRGLQLTAPEDGIDFDLLGENQAVPHAKTRISWPRNSNYMFLVLPDARGEVKGINELFGNNTRGPDGKFASDGYAALAKHDLNQDSIIDSKDQVYAQLALWSDRNRNGRAERGEIMSLTQAQIKNIDLKYDANFFEEDKFGNQSRMKSVVERFNGRLNVIFDLWFIVK